MLNLKAKRKLKGISGKDFAKMIGVAPSTLCGYESGIAEPKVETMMKMSEILNCSIDELVGNETKKKED